MTRHFVFPTLLVAFLFVAPGIAKELLVNSSEELVASSKEAKPGDTLTIREGKWKDQYVELKLEGTAKAPITVRCKTLGTHQFTGKTKLDISGKHIVLDRLTFSDGCLEKGPVINVSGEHCRVTRCIVKNYNPPRRSTNYHWISLSGHHHRVDHSHISGKNHAGCMLVVWLKDKVAGHHIIDHNYFGDFRKSSGNGFETIRIGTSHTHRKDAHCLVYQNLFEHCDGEMEIISNKSGANQYLANTFFESQGCLSLRRGKNCLVSHNLFLGNDVDETGGVRVMDSGHRILANHFKRTGGRAEGAISLVAGVPGSPDNGNMPVDGGEIRSNLFWRNRKLAICYDAGMGEDSRSILPKNLRFEGNLFVGRDKSQIESELGKKVGKWNDNQYLSSIPDHPEIFVPYQLQHSDVGPSARIEPRLDVTSNSHRFGKVDVLSHLAFCVPNPASLSGIVIDETGAELEGAWQYSTHTPPYLGIGYLYSKKGTNKPARATFSFTPTERGSYAVQLSYCAKPNRSKQTLVTVGHAAGDTKLVVDQRQVPTRKAGEKSPGPDHLFRTVGFYDFAPGKPAFVRIESDPREMGVAIADAVRFVLQK